MLTEAYLLTRYMGQVASVSFFYFTLLYLRSLPPPPSPAASKNRKKNYLGITSETHEAFIESLGRSISPARNLAEKNDSASPRMIVMKNELCLSTGNISSKEKVAYRTFTSLITVISMLVEAVIQLITVVLNIRHCHTQRYLSFYLQKSDKSQEYHFNAFIATTDLIFRDLSIYTNSSYL